MFCAECGTKNESGAQFCENCGHKLEENSVSQVTTAPKTSERFSTKLKKMSKQNKIIAVVATVVAVSIIALYIVLNNMTKPEAVAEKYFNATMSYDLDAVYSFLDVSESKFTTKEVFKKINEKEEDEELPKVINYTVGKPLQSADGLSATVTITYILDGEKDSETADIKLAKSKDKKWFLFDNWKVNVTGNDTVKGYKIEVMKDSKVTVEGIDVDKKYIDKDESDDEVDVYSMPAMFTTYYDVVVKLPMGIEVEDKMLVKKDSKFKYSISIDNLTDKMKKNVTNAAKSGLQTIYDGVKDKKTFDEIKSAFEYKDADLSDLKDAYEDLVEDIDSSITFTDVDIKDVTLNRVSITDGNFRFYIKAKFDYKLTYQSGEETKTNDSDTSGYMYLTFKYVDGSFKLIDASNLHKSFSKYY